MNQELEKVKSIPEFLVIIPEKLQRIIVLAIDFTSMSIANSYSDLKDWKNPLYILARETYWKTKKDVIEFKRKKPEEALIDNTVIKFTSKFSMEIYKEFSWHGNEDPEFMKRYIQLCNEKIGV